MGAQIKSAIDLNPHHQEEILRILGIYMPDIEVRAFGSRVKWTAKPYSDLDLVLMTQKPLSLDQEAQLREAFDESTLPFKVDFVDWASTSKNFQKIISADSVLFRKPSRYSSAGKWAVMPLEEALDALLDYRGKTPEKTSFGIPLITAKIVKAGRIEPATEFIAREKFAEWMTRGLPRVGDVLLTTEAPLGEVAQLHTDQVALAQRLVALRGKAGVLDNTYLCYLLQTGEMQEQLAARATGTTVLGIKQSELRKIVIRLPPLEQQRAAAAILSVLDDRITLLRETNATLEAIAQALFKSWFVDFDPVRAKMEGRTPEGMDEATAALFPDGFETSELGEVPRGWRVCAVEEFADRVGMGPFGSNIKVETFVESGIPVISGQHLKQLLVEDNTFNFITHEHAARLAKSCVQAGDVIFTHAGSIGQVSLLHKDAAFTSYVLSQRQFFLRCNTESMSPEWIALYFKSPAGQHQLLANTSQVGVPSIARPVSYLRSIRLVVPPPELNQQFASIAGAINDRVMANRKQFGALTQIRDTLLPRLISSQLSMPEAQNEVMRTIE